MQNLEFQKETLKFQDYFLTIFFRISEIRLEPQKPFSKNIPEVLLKPFPAFLFLSTSRILLHLLKESRKKLGMAFTQQPWSLLAASVLVAMVYFSNYRQESASAFRE